MKKFPNSAQLCAGIAFLAPLLSVYAPLALAPLLSAAAVLFVTGWIAGRRADLVFIPSLLLLLTGIAVLAALSTFWTIDRAETLGRLPRPVLLFIAGTVFLCAAAALDAAARASIGRWMIAGLVLAIAALLLERGFGGVLAAKHLDGTNANAFLNLFNRGLTVCAILVWPAIMCTMRIRKVYGVAMGIALFASLFAFVNDAAIVAMIAGALTFGLVCAVPRIAGRLVTVVTVAVVLVVPFADRTLPPPKELFETMHLPRSTYHRLLIWHFASDHIVQRPLLGWGFNSSRAIPGGKSNLDVSEPALPLHPHNGALQLWLELGVGGALLGAGLLAAATEGARRFSRGRLEQAAATATISAALIVLLVSYGIWQSWWMSALFIAAGCAIIACGRPPSERTA